MELRESRCYDIDCIDVEIGEYKLTLTESFGPRILRFGFADRVSIFGEHPTAAVKTELGVWKPLGGHRLWVAPENRSTSYAPDDHSIEIEEEDGIIDLIAPADAAGFQKQISISAEDHGRLLLRHTVTNVNDVAREVAAWTLTIMQGGGIAYLPMEPFISHAEELLPVRQLALWGYTDLTDPRWNIGNELIGLHIDERYSNPQKIGAGNKQGWLGYRVGDQAFVKSFSYDDCRYPDMNSNCEIYTAGSFVELESLSPLRVLQPGESITHDERWILRSGIEWSDNEEEIARIFRGIANSTSVK